MSRSPKRSDSEVRWRVWFDDGSVYDSSSHSWDELPDDGVVARMLYLPNGGRQNQSGADHYFEAPHPKGTIYGFSSDSIRTIKKRYPGAVVKRGKWVPDDFYDTVVEEAIKSEAP